MLRVGILDLGVVYRGVVSHATPFRGRKSVWLFSLALFNKSTSSELDIFVRVRGFESLLT